MVGVRGAGWRDLQGQAAVALHNIGLGTSVEGVQMARDKGKRVTPTGSNGDGEAADATGRNGEKPKEKLSGKQYAAALRDLHVELVRLQEWVKHAGVKICIVFEGRDGAGKGGTIKALTERVSPRVFRVVALPAPTEREKSQMYLQRYIRYLPAAGEVVIFDRSWYNRAGVERVMGFCSEAQVKRFLGATPLVEKAIVDSGIILLKYWLEVSPDEQTRRLEARITDGRKIWKLSPMDLKSYSRWFDYSRARDEMFQATDSSWAPWYVVRSDDKKSARLNIIRHLLDNVPYQSVPREKVKLPKRQKQGDYRETRYPFKVIPEAY
jgi:polyphosphate kinase